MPRKIRQQFFIITGVQSRCIPDLDKFSMFRLGPLLIEDFHIGLCDQG